MGRQVSTVPRDRGYFQAQPILHRTHIHTQGEAEITQKKQFPPAVPHYNVIALGSIFAFLLKAKHHRDQTMGTKGGYFNKQFISHYSEAYCLSLCFLLKS